MGRKDRKAEVNMEPAAMCYGPRGMDGLHGEAV